ncbi:MAG: DUF2179 domain-containing protein [Clostridiales bacterium]|nr:DUF2179 domain-containing protein [Clostridiales bacterium]
MLFYFIVFFAKIFEVSIGTVRVVLITRGERLIGAIMGFFEVMIWIVIVGNVLSDISSDPLKAVAYAGGFAVGNYVGSWIEEKLGIGTAEVQAIVLKEHGKELAEAIRQEGYAVTIVEGQGKNFPRNILSMYISRKKIKHVIGIIQKNQSNAVITVSEAKPVYGGFKLLRK